MRVVTRNDQLRWDNQLFVTVGWEGERNRMGMRMREKTGGVRRRKTERVGRRMVGR